MARIYIETTVFSFYFNARTEPEMVARENGSRRWLDRTLDGRDELVTSLAVKSELDAGDLELPSHRKREQIWPYSSHH